MAPEYLFRIIGQISFIAVYISQVILYFVVLEI